MSADRRFPTVLSVRSLYIGTCFCHLLDFGKDLNRFPRGNTYAEILTEPMCNAL